MTETKNRVKYGLSNVHYAVATIAEDGSATYGTEKPWPGAVSLSMKAEGDSQTFYADNIKYYVSYANNGYSGSLECAQIPADFEADVLGAITDGNGMIVESADAPTTHFALLFEFAGDVSSTRHVMYNCVAARPEVSGKTTQGSREPQTDSIDITAGTIYDKTLKANIVKAKAVSGSAGYDAWYTDVPVPTAEG